MLPSVTVVMGSNAVRNEQDSPDTLVPDPVVWAEFGVTEMTGHRWDQDPTLGFPPKIKIRRHNYRSRRALEEFKERMVAQAIKARAVKLGNRETRNTKDEGHAND
jgi:hypothetical protein